MHTSNVETNYSEYVIVALQYSFIIIYSIAVALSDQQREENIFGYDRGMLLYPRMMYGKPRCETPIFLK
jgi:hypothetical protein